MELPAAGTNFEERLLDWLHFKARSIPPRPRSVRVSAEVARRTADFPAIDAIKAELEKGADLRPRLSDRVRKRKADPHADMMYNDWQIIHFHLGDVAANEVKRTDEVKRT